MNLQEFKIVGHSLGIKNPTRCTSIPTTFFREYFCVGREEDNFVSENHHICKRLTEKGLMSRSTQMGNIYFFVTKEGKERFIELFGEIE